MEVHVREEQLLAVEGDTVRHANIADIASGACGADRLHHGLLRADAFQCRVRADSIRQFLDASNACITALAEKIRGAKFASELLARRVAADGEEWLGSHVL